MDVTIHKSVAGYPKKIFLEAPNRDESNELVEIGSDWRIRQNDLVAIEERRASLRESLRSLNNRIMLEKGPFKTKIIYLGPRNRS